jgi:diguanylate cyclase (GGDEF)-like protein/PAS domain S-box-containing protein
VLAGVAVSIAGPLILIGGERYPETGWRGGPLLLLCCAGVGFVVQALLARERAAAARRARLLAVMGDGVIVTDGSGRVLEVNDALCRMTGYGPDELLGRGAPLPSWPEEDHAALLEAHTAAIAAGGGAIEARLERKDGTELFVQITLAVDRHGEPTVIATVRDVTEQVRLREQLTSERDFSATILDAMQDGFGVTRDREIQEVNAALCRITGFTREQLIGTRQPFPFWPPELHEDIGALRDRIHAANGGSYEVEFQRADGSRFIAEATTVALPEGGGFLNTVRDISERKQHERAIQERSHQLAALAGMTRALAHAAPSEARRTVCETALRIADASTASIWEADPDGVLHCTISVGAPAAEFSLGPGDRTDGARRAFDTGLATYVADAASSPAVNRARVEAIGAASAHFQPIVAEGRITGVLALTWRTRREALGAAYEQLIELLAHEASFTIARAAAHARLEQLARTDALTGLANRRTLEELFPREIATANRTGQPLTLAFIDLDHFKRFNDTYGHSAGDGLLRAVAAAWPARLRETDLLARWGGEEFCLLLPGCTAEGAAALLDALRDMVPERQTFSAGIAEWEPGDTAAALIELADAALYRAKREGRARSVDARDASSSAPSAASAS